jgi:AcrR family transcriptional regulator
MPRRRPHDRLDRLLDCAVAVFTERGYRRTQMADVAAAMGVAPGTLYLYVESKEALFHLLIERGWTEVRTPPPALPVRTPAPGATLRVLRARLMRATRLPTLRAARTRRQVADTRAELESIVRELYAMVTRHRHGIRLLERSALDWPELAALFYDDMRRRMLQDLTGYLQRRIAQRRLRPVPDVAAAARLINETVAWFAMHRYGDKQSADVSDAAAEATVVDVLVHALALPRNGEG